jgi:hypothetical protein
MTTSKWIETLLPKVTERLYKELLLLDPVPETDEYEKTPTVAAWYHLSRHAKRMKVTRATKKTTTGKLPPPCPHPLPGCKAYGLARALLACQSGSPGIAAVTVTRYADAASSARLALEKILDKLGPATREFLRLLRPQAAALRPQSRELLPGAELRLQSIERIWQDMDSWGESVLDEFSTTFTKLNSPNTRHHRHYIDLITEALLSSGFTDEEIAEFVPDGVKGGDAEQRVSNRRYKLTGTREGGSSRKPGRPKKVPSET